MAYTFDPQRYDILTALATGGVPQQFPTQPVQPQTSTDIVNNATAQAANEAAQDYAKAQSVGNAIQRGAQIQQQQQAGQIRSGLLGGLPQEDYRQDPMMQAVLGYKDQYNTAKAAGDAQGMADAAAGAQVIRDYAAKNGVDLSGTYADAGATNSRAQLAAAIQARNALRMGQILNAPDSATYYDRVYQQARQQGASDRVAKRYAGEQAEQYQARLLSDLGMVMQNQGISQDGFINKIGAQIIARMYDEDPNGMAQVYNSYFGKPVQLGMWNLAEQSQDRAQGRKKDLLSHQEGLQEKYSNVDYLHRIGIIDEQGRINLEALSKQLESNERVEQAKSAALIAAAQAKGSRSGGGNGSGSDGLTEKQINGAGDAESLVLQLISSAKSGGDMDLDKYNQEVAKLKNVDSDTKTWLKEEVPYAYNFVREFVRNKDGGNTKAYWDDIKDDQHLRGFIPADYAQYMENKG